MTPKQYQIALFVQDYIEDSGFSPTLDEISQKFRVTKVTVYEHVKQLVAQGVLSRTKHQARSLRVLTPVDPPHSTVRVSKDALRGVLVESGLHPDCADSLINALAHQSESDLSSPTPLDDEPVEKVSVHAVL